MRTELRADEIGFYRANGFLTVADFLDAGELRVWREAVDEALVARGDQVLVAGDDARFAADLEKRREEATEQEKEAGEYYEKVFAQRINLWQTSEKVRALMLDRRLGRLAADLAGVDGIRIWLDQALVKPPCGNYTSYHIDVPYWSFTSPDALSIWVALDDATSENGCLYYLPGSQMVKKYDNVGIGKDLGGLFEAYPEWRDIDPVPCPLRAGGAAFHNGLTAHGAGANMTHGQRRAMTCAYMPDGSTFNGNPDILPSTYVDTLEIGDLLDSDNHNPLIFSHSNKPLAMAATT